MCVSSVCRCECVCERVCKYMCEKKNIGIVCECV